MGSFTSFINSLFSPFGNFLSRLVFSLGDLVSFGGRTILWIWRPPFRWGQLMQQMEFIGVKSVGIILLVGLFSGAVFALQTHYAFSLFNAESMVGATVCIALARELAPVFTALMVVARAGSAMAAELGTMKVTEQIDAMSVMAVNPIQYLVVPRVVSGFWMVPLLTILFDAVGAIGAYLVGVRLMRIPEGPFLMQIQKIVDGGDLAQGVIKGAIFGFVLTIIATHRGLKTEGGAQGVGRSTTRAVVIASVSILVLDYFLTTWIIEFFPKF